MSSPLKRRCFYPWRVFDQIRHNSPAVIGYSCVCILRHNIRIRGAANGGLILKLPIIKAYSSDRFGPLCRRWEYWSRNTLVRSLDIVKGLSATVVRRASKVQDMTRIGSGMSAPLGAESVSPHVDSNAQSG